MIEHRLFCAVTEDDIEYDGGNGYTPHNQALRRVYPDLDGVIVQPQAGTQEFIVDCPLDDAWDYARLRATVFIQNMATRGCGIRGRSS